MTYQPPTQGPDPTRPAPQQQPGQYQQPSSYQQYGAAPAWPAAPQTSNTVAIFAHLSSLIGGIILSVILRVVTKDEDEFNRHHTNEAVNRDLVYLVFSLPMIIGFFAMYISMFSTMMSQSTDPEAAPAFPFAAFGWFWVIWLIQMGLGVYMLVLTIMGAIAAGKNRYIRLALPFRLVKGSLSRAECDARNLALDRAQTAAMAYYQQGPMPPR